MKLSTYWRAYRIAETRAAQESRAFSFYFKRGQSVVAADYARGLARRERQADKLAGRITETIAALDAEASATGRSRSYAAAQRIEQGAHIANLVRCAKALTNLQRNPPILAEFSLIAALAPFETGAAIEEAGSDE